MAVITIKLIDVKLPSRHFQKISISKSKALATPLAFSVL